MSGTLPETNIAPENRTSEKEHSIPTIHVQVLCYFLGMVYVHVGLHFFFIADWYQKVTF